MSTVPVEKPSVDERVNADEKPHIVPLSLFNEGKANEVFDEVRRTGTKLVVNDDDDSAVCIIMTPEDYMRMSDDYEDIKLRAVAEDRWNNFDESQLISQEEIDREFGITPEDLEGWEDIELE
ncbi:MAG: hypothetical protein IJP48_02950 [Synergistaceae bacterium]|nr:hypothetical protein [Synergistaceae bacterium]